MTPALKEFIETRSWRYQMDASQGLDGHSNYSGGMDKADWIVSCGRNRDSDILQESNFQSALYKLGGASKNVEVARFGHWSSGWFELILVNPKSIKHVKTAYEISQALDNCTILDENDYYERQSEYYSDYANGAKNDVAAALEHHFGLKATKTLIGLAYDLNMICQHMLGADSCVNIYVHQLPNSWDIRRLKEILHEMEHSHAKSRTYKSLVHSVNEYEAALVNKL